MLSRWSTLLKRIILGSFKEIVLPDPKSGHKHLQLVLLADLHSPDHFMMNEVDPLEFDMVLTLGDINEPTLDYILNQGRAVSIFGVYGNHDPEFIPGMRSLDRHVVVLNGYKIGGISGVNEFYQCPHSYKEKTIAQRLKRMGPVDVLIAHVPPYSISKDEDRVHQGFKALDDYILKYQPKYVFYGHLHRRQRHVIGKTQVVGIYGKEFVAIK